MEHQQAVAALRESQRRDPLWGEIITALEHGEADHSTLTRGMILDGNGALVRRHPADATGTGATQVCTPAADAHGRIEKAHSSLLGAHFGERRTLERLRRDSYWPGMARDVKHYVRNCRPCQQAKLTCDTKRRTRQIFDEDEAPSEPWQVVHIDHVVNLPTTTRGNKHILSATCRLTRATLFIPVKSLSATDTADALINGVFLVKGFLKKLVADKSTSWRNDLWTALCRALTIRLAMTVSHRAQGNGMGERPHRYLNVFLRTLPQADQRRWDRVLGFLTFAYCQGVCRSTGQTPHYLEHGRDLPGPVEYQVDIPQTAPATIQEYLGNLRGRLRAAWQAAQTASATAAREALDRADDGVTTTLYDDQLVWVTRVAAEPVLEERQSRRLLPRLTGPWRVLHRHDNALTTYRLRHVQTGREASFNIDQIVPIRGASDGGVRPRSAGRRCRGRGQRRRLCSA